jgi:hypothetical protein
LSRTRAAAADSIPNVALRLTFERCVAARGVHLFDLPANRPDSVRD